MPGEILGLDAIEAGQHVNSARALETTAVYEIAYTQVENLSTKIPNLQSHMYRLLSKEIREDQELQMLLGKNRRGANRIFSTKPITPDSARCNPTWFTNGL